MFQALSSKRREPRARIGLYVWGLLETPDDVLEAATVDRRAHYLESS